MKISAYTTTLNCIQMDYPFTECLDGLLSFADEVCIADGGSTDGTVEKILDQFPTVQIETFPIDLGHPRWAIHSDGYLKAKARDLCSGDVLWQSDNDEIIDPAQSFMVRELCEISHSSSANLSIPILEFWGSPFRVRTDIPPKPRISPNTPLITHGIPSSARGIDDNGDEYCTPYLSDSCDYINKTTGTSLPFSVASRHPFCIWHLSWLDLKRKISHYKKHWRGFHNSMYNLNNEDTAENNVMFDKPWAEVSTDDISFMAMILSNNGPRFFHSKQREWAGVTAPIPEGLSVPDSVVQWARNRGIK